MGDSDPADDAIYATKISDATPDQKRLVEMTKRLIASEQERAQLEEQLKAHIVTMTVAVGLLCQDSYGDLSEKSLKATFDRVNAKVDDYERSAARPKRRRPTP